MIVIGTAGWTVPAANRGDVTAAGTALGRYSVVFNGVEINSTFRQTHRAGTFARWRDAVPKEFRFSLKLPRAITHEKRLIGCAADVSLFLASISPLDDKLGPLLVQLPPSLQFEAPVVTDFFADLRSKTNSRIVCEPRHASWFSTEADDLLAAMLVSRVAADPPVVPAAGAPGGFTGFCYVRLHGAPRVYYSSYEADDLCHVASRLTATQADSWCIFDNTASGAAFGDALMLKQILAGLASR